MKEYHRMQNDACGKQRNNTHPVQIEP